VVAGGSVAVEVEESCAMAFPARKDISEAAAMANSGFESHAFS
jgi:hypothetical protein